MESPATPSQGHPQPHSSSAPTYYPPYYSWGYPTPYNAFPGIVFNTGGNRNESGKQENGNIEIGNRKEKSGGCVDIDNIGGNHANTNGQQRAGHDSLGNITTAL